ncbi:hypothetical protein FD975_06550 [Polynucleobacter sp. AP-Jannik-300A-C4]|uniref:hypothetical protein n=1 Tax=Polynucleobacter sp. AP-Jannik-300A-C4 TaxID=2576928 RepID=UPI001BFD86B7|nr:hypothetical protein [Polynucleobacter sp. AP-Jannik-300A-C4]QWE21938.1 hypothetical protein FD975_06550 [Polynucleobacter sp. AP-Jannik-300A-C4]
MPDYIKRANASSLGNLRFVSTASLERGLDGSYETFYEYFFAIYHCSYAEDSGIKERRLELSKTYPKNVVVVGDYFVLTGEAAYQALRAYYYTLTITDTLSEEYREYIAKRLEDVTTAHKESQSLPIPIDLTEGQLANDKKMELLTCIAIGNGQVVLQNKA